MLHGYLPLYTSVCGWVAVSDWPGSKGAMAMRISYPPTCKTPSEIRPTSPKCNPSFLWFASAHIRHPLPPSQKALDRKFTKKKQVNFFFQKPIYLWVKE